MFPGPDGHVLTLPEAVTVSELIHEAVHLRQLELRPQDVLTDPERAEEVARRLTEELVERVDEVVQLNHGRAG